jgi:hypothetical protein
MRARWTRRLAIGLGLCAAGASLAGAPAAWAAAGDDARLVGNRSTVPAGFPFFGGAQCDPGQRAIGGGVGMASANTNYMIASAPRARSIAATVDGSVADGWLVAIRNGTTFDLVESSYAICSASSDASVQVEELILPAAAPGPVASYGERAVQCPPGQRALSGGVTATTGGTSPERIEASGPLDRTGQTANTTTGDIARYWFAEVRNFDTAAGRTFEVYAVCSGTSRAIITSKPLSFGNGENGRLIYCPEGTRATGGGAVSATNNRQFLESSRPTNAPDAGVEQSGDTPRGWKAEVDNWSGSQATENFTVICEPATATVPSQPSPTSSTAGPTGRRAAALAKCKKRAHKQRSKRARKRCRRKAALLPA